MKRLQALCLGSALLLISAIANAQVGHVLHVATQYGETTFNTDIVDSIYFDEEDGDQTAISMESIKVFQEQQNIYPSDLFTQSLVMCHRGLAGFPENTYEALEAAIKVGYKMVECDIARTKDGVFVLQHDATIDRCSNGTGRVDSCYFAYLQQLDFGSWYNADFSYVRIAALEDIIKLCKRKNVILELDIADNDRFQDSYLEDLFKLVQKYGMLSRTIFCAKKPRLEALQAISSCVCVSVSGVTNIKTADEAFELKSKALSINVSIPFTHITKELCEYVHSKGMYVKTWTYNRDTYMEEAFEKGADYVIVKNIIPSSNVRGDESEENED